MNLAAHIILYVALGFVFGWVWGRLTTLRKVRALLAKARGEKL